MIVGPLNLANIQRNHARFVQAHTWMVRSTLDEAGRFAQQHVRNHADFTHRTGKLASQTDYKVVRKGNGQIVRVFNRAKYAAAQDLGSGLYGPRRAKYPIRPKRAKALRFMVRGKLVITRKVMHPGVRPTRFLWNATDAAYRGFGTMALNRMVTLSRKFSLMRA